MKKEKHRTPRSEATSEPSARSHEEARDGLSMAPELMLDLARKAAELMVARIEGLPKENAWEGDFQQILADQLMEDPPERGRPAAEVLERAAREILPIALQFDHPRSIRVHPVVAHVARGAGRLHGRRVQQVNLCTWLIVERSDPTRVGRHRLVPALDRLSGERRRALHERRVRRPASTPFVAAREAAGHPERRDRLHERPEP